MRAIGGLGTLLFAIGAIYYLSVAGANNKDEGVDIPIAFSKPANNQVEMHVLIGMVLANTTDGKNPSLKPKSWDEWIKERFALKDTAGQAVALRRQTSSAVIKAHDVTRLVGTEEFFMVAPLKVGQNYEFEFIRNPASGKRYRFSFTAPAAPHKVEPKTFAPVTP